MQGELRNSSYLQAAVILIDALPPKCGKAASCCLLKKQQQQQQDHDQSQEEVIAKRLACWLMA